MQYETKDIRITATKDHWESIRVKMQQRQIRKRNQYFLALSVEDTKADGSCQAKSPEAAA